MYKREMFEKGRSNRAGAGSNQICVAAGKDDGQYDTVLCTLLSEVPTTGKFKHHRNCYSFVYALYYHVRQPSAATVYVTRASSPVFPCQPTHCDAHAARLPTSAHTTHDHLLGASPAYTRPRPRRVRGILLYPVLDTLVDNMIARMATLAVLRGRVVRVRSTRLGSFGPNTVYWGSKRWRYLILLAALLYSALSLAGEFGFGSTQVDLARAGRFARRTTMSSPSRSMSALDVPRDAPAVAAAHFACVSSAPPVELRVTEYPREFAAGNRSQRLAWCKRARALVTTGPHRKLDDAHFERHCSELHEERGGDYQLVFNGGLSLTGNLRLLRFHLFGMKPKFALSLYGLDVRSMAAMIRVRGKYRRGTRYFAAGKLACAEPRYDRRLLCLVDDVRKSSLEVLLLTSQN
eukprot:IDg18385t1